MIELIPEYFILFIQTLFYPMTNFCLPLLNQRLNERRQFENKNLLQPACKSFKETHEKAQYCFEISSEGEFEQIAPLLIDLLQSRLKLELIFCSPSVEKRVERLTAEYSNLRMLRLPLLTFSWFGQSASRWSTAPTIILCRYDFFPELMLMVKKRGGILISASLMGKKHCPWYLKRYYHFFAELLVATQSDYQRFQDELSLPPHKLNFLELRFIQIERRLSDKEQVFKSKDTTAYYSDWLKRTNQKKLIIGSMWPGEIALISQEMKEDIKASKLHLTIFPHQLSGVDYEQLLDHLQATLEDCPLLILDDKITLVSLKESLRGPLVVVYKLKGMLCEFYPLFDFAYVGGGHGRSIHSVLEPYLAGPLLFCGPKTHRSTEYLIVVGHTPEEIRVIEKLEFFYDFLLQSEDRVNVELNLEKRLELIRQMNGRYKKFFEKFIEAK